MGRKIILGFLLLCAFQSGGFNEKSLTSICNRNQSSCYEERDLYLVAHADDDLLFMNPDILTNIIRGHAVETIYFTAGDKRQKAHYWLSREAGVKAAYAAMGGVSNVWIEDRVEFARKKLARFTLQALSKIKLIFLRLPDGIDRQSGEVTLCTLWKDGQVVIRSKDQTNFYRRAELMEVLKELLINFKATSVSYICPGNHVDHCYVCKFAGQAEKSCLAWCNVIRYQDYCSSLSPPNLNQWDAFRKWKIAEVYGKYDSYFPKRGDEKYYPLYYQWCQRKYYYPAPNADQKIFRYFSNDFF